MISSPLVDDRISAACQQAEDVLLKFYTLTRVAKVFRPPADLNWSANFSIWLFNNTLFRKDV
jgi:hypothetical protein